MKGNPNPAHNPNLRRGQDGFKQSRRNRRVQVRRGPWSALSINTYAEQLERWGFSNIRFHQLDHAWFISSFTAPGATT